MLDHLDDVASDFSVFHRVEDITQLDGPSFFRLAWRLPSYRGAMREAVLREQDESPREQRQAPREASARGGSERRSVPATKTALTSDPAFKGIFAFG